MISNITNLFIDKIPFLNYVDIMRYTLGRFFQNDFKDSYKEDETFLSGRIFEVTGNLNGNRVLNSSICLRNDKNLNKQVVLKNFYKIQEHQKKILDIIYSNDFDGNVDFKIPLMHKEKYNLLEKFIKTNICFNISHQGYKFNENHYQEVLISPVEGINVSEIKNKDKILIDLIYSKI